MSTHSNTSSLNVSASVNDMLVSCRRLLESSLLSLSRYDMSGSRDHPIYPDPARYSNGLLPEPEEDLIQC